MRNPFPSGRHGQPGRVLWLLVVALGCGLVALPGRAASEYEIKAAFLLNFARFVDWPAAAFPNSEAPLTVCVLGQDPFGPLLEGAMRDKTANSRRLAIKRFHSIQELESCHILFVSASERNNLHQVWKAIAGANVLTVSDMERFAHLGGVINLVLERKKIGIEINESAAQKARLKISAKLMKVARLVPPEG